MKDSWICAIRELKRRKRRTFATLAGYFLAVTFMVVLISLLNFAKELTTGVSKDIGKHFIAYSPRIGLGTCELREDNSAEGFIVQDIFSNVLDRRLINRIRAVPSVLDVSPFLYFRFQDRKTGAIFTVGGFEPGDSIATRTTTCEANDVVSGRFLTPEDRGLVMLEETYAISKNLQPGDKIDVAGITFSVVGIVRQSVKPVRPNVMMHIDDATRAINRRLAVPIKDQINVVLVEAKTSDVNAEAQQAVQNLIPKGVATGFLCYSPAAKITRVTEIAVWLLSIVVGGASILLSMRSQSASVIERQREIGIFKAVGWTDGNIVSLIVAESVLQAIAGGCFGFLLGTAVLAIIPFGGLIKQLLFVETVFPKSWAPITLSLLHASMIWVLIILGGIAGGILAAVPAVRLRPADALRRI